MNKWLLPILAGSVALLSFWGGWFEKRIDYNHDVKPILNKHCIKCHGGVKKAGGVSFLFEEDLYKPAKSGKVPVIAGDADESEMIRRILSKDSDERMPKNEQPLSEEDITVLKKWINQGAEWGVHWAYLPIKKPNVPNIGGLFAWIGLSNNEETQWAKNEIDHFTLDKLKDLNLTPANEADPATLIRRVSIDLTGLPPTEAQVKRFLNDKRPNAYQILVDSLLASSAYGERWAGMWLDLARYADTKGYERDPGRNIWRYRDWLIKAFNQDKPFDEFTIEQLAGDLLKNPKTGLPTDDQLIATGFHRNTMNNDEGGTVDEEFRTAALLDRVNTTWDVWQSTSFGCVQCHSHPYDPIRHDEYYKYMAFFNNTRDEDVTSDTPTLHFYHGKDSTNITKIENWLVQNKASKQQINDFKQFVRVVEPKINSHEFDRHINASLLDAKYLGIKDTGSAHLRAITLTGKDRLLIATGTGGDNAVLRLRLDSRKGPIIATIPVPNGSSDSVKIIPLKPVTGKHELFMTVENPKNKDKWVQIKWIAFQKALGDSTLPDLKSIEETYADILTGYTENTPVFVEGTGDLARETHVFERGNWTVKGKKVNADIPNLFKNVNQNLKNPKINNRLALAKWMTSPDNPLTARVMVNRIWEQLFGTGIVETVEDFGSQGIAPTHQELLDWLAANWMEDQKWSMKKLLKTIVTSATYRQSAAITPEKLANDPSNKYFSRGPRIRLTAEQIRDQVLAVSGLLSKKMLGPSVMPPQPDGVWQSPYSGENWVLSQGEDRYRRALYTYWKRSAPYPSMVAFDAPSREFCQSRRIRTNTPLQALVTLNDPVYIEAAQKLAEKMAVKPTPTQQIEEGYRLLTFKAIPKNRLAILMRFYQNSLKSYQQDPNAACELLNFTDSKKVSPELAALATTANVLLNLDEIVTK